MIIAIDLDEVIADTFGTLIDYFNKKLGGKVDHKTMKEVRLWKLYELEPEVAQSMLFEFYESDLFRNLKPYPEAKEYLQKLKELGHSLTIVTARHHETWDATMGWINKYFPDIFTSVFLTSAFSPDKTKAQTKSSICINIQADIFIDDTFDHILDCADHVKKCFMLNKPWNLDITDLPKNTERVDSWPEILERIQNDFTQEIK